MARRLRAPSTTANVARNEWGEPDRARRWRPARDALWRFLDTRLVAGARVAVVGAGNGDDLPLTRLAARAETVVLIDLDRRAGLAARRREPRSLRRRIAVCEHEITDGAANAIVRAAVRGDAPREVVVPGIALPGAPYDLVIGDLLYSQLLFPGLLDTEVPEPRRQAVLAACAPGLTRSVVARLHASAPRVLHMHDQVAWWPGHPQPFTLREALAVEDREAALRLVARGTGPLESDPRPALAALGLRVTAGALWHWPFAPGVDYLVSATFS